MPVLDSLGTRCEASSTEEHLIVRDFFPPEEITAVRAQQDEFYLGKYDTSPSFPWPKPRPCRAKSRKHPYASFFCSRLATLLRDGRLAQLIRTTYELKALRFWHDQLLYEEPRTEAKLDYHWHREESRWLTCAATQMVTAWIPLIDFGAEMGPITIMIGDEPRRIVLNAGDLVLFDATVLHGNPPNLGSQPRRALAAHFASADLHYRAHGKFSHVNERIVRKIDDVPDFQDPAVCPLLP